MPDAKARQDELSRVIGTIAQSNPDKAFELLGQLPADANLEDLVASMAWSLGSASIEQINGYAERLSDPAARNRMLQSVLQSKVSQGAPDQAVELLVQIPEGDDRKNAFRSFTNSWAHQDPYGASAWLDQLPAGNDRDSAAAGFSQSVINSDPESALVWAASIAEPALRKASIDTLSRQWLKRDRAAAEPWIQATDLLTAEQRENLLEAPKPKSAG